MSLLSMLLLSMSLLSMPQVSRAAVVDTPGPPSPEEDPANWYHIDIILFSPANPNLTEENWQLAEPAYPHDVLAIAPGEELLPFRLSQLAQLRKEAREAALIDAVLKNSHSTDDPSDPDEAADEQDESAESSGTHDTLSNPDEAAATEPDAGQDDDLLSASLAFDSSVFDVEETLDEAATLAFGQFAFEPALASPSMLELASSMRLSSQYQVWAQLSWTQPITEQARPMMLQAGQRFDDRYEFEGTLNFRRTRYIHLRPHIWYTQYEQRSRKRAPRRLAPGADDTNLEQALLDVEARRGLYAPLQTYQITWDQRLRRGEIHYLDHPLFGLLVRVRRYAIPDAIPDAILDAIPDAIPDAVPDAIPDAIPDAN